MGVHLTPSLQRYLWVNARRDYVLILFGHIELIEKHWDDYIEWCKTDEGRSYLAGGENYNPDPVVEKHASKMSIEECRYGYKIKGEEDRVD